MAKRNATFPERNCKGQVKWFERRAHQPREHYVEVPYGNEGHLRWDSSFVSFHESFDNRDSENRSVFPILQVSSHSSYMKPDVGIGKARLLQVEKETMFCTSAVRGSNCLGRQQCTNRFHLAAQQAIVVDLHASFRMVMHSAGRLRQPYSKTSGGKLQD